MIYQYFFILGKTPELSKAEIHSLFTKKGINFSVLEYGPQFFIVQIDQEIDVVSFFKTLGGSIKAGQIVEQISVKGKSHLGSIENTVTYDWLENVLPATDKKTVFGFSIYGSRKNTPFRLVHSLNKLGVSLKKEMRNKGVVSKFITSKKPDLSSVVVGQNKLIDRGADLCFFLLNSKIFIGQTLVVQDYKKYSERDYGRPGRDAKSGMLPPKLARMMINLVSAQQGQVILDPFCGSGTILIEALDIGYQNILGSDISEVAISDSQKNITWYLEHFGQKQARSETKKCDARKLSACFKQKSIDAIIGEPYLGPPLKGNEQKEGIQKTVTLLEEIYLESFKEFAKVLKDGGRIVIIFPALIDRRNDIGYLNITAKIKKLGFCVQAFPKYVVPNKRGALEYARPGQHLIREIFVWQKS